MMILCSALGWSAMAQQQSPFPKFGKVTAEDLQKKVYSIDSNAHAVVLSDRGSISVVGNNKGWFSLEFKRHKVVHILDKTAYTMGNVEIPLYTNGEDEEKIDQLKGITYNLENGKVVESKLEKSSVFREKVSKNKVLRKFTMPNIREGSIIEYEYTVISDYLFSVDPWLFQGRAPVLWSELRFTVPQFYTYNFMNRGYHPLHLHDKKDNQMNFVIFDSKSSLQSERYSFSAGVTEFRWVMKDVPELKEESFTSSLSNHIARMEFELTSQSDPLTPRNFRESWPNIMLDLLKSEYFGAGIEGGNGWLEDDIRPVFASGNSDLEKAVKIFYFVSNGISSTGNGGIFMSQSLKQVMKTKKGTATDINMLLAAMLRQTGIEADPVLVSTRNHGYAIEYFPTTKSFNYVVIRAVINGRKYYLDASMPRLGFGRLHPSCYNGHARVVNRDATPVYFEADSLVERKNTLLVLVNEKGKWAGAVQQNLGDYGSLQTRNAVADEGREAFFRKLEKEYGSEAIISNLKIDSLGRLNDPVKLSYSIEIPSTNEGMIYFNPMFGERYKKNPFNALERYYPVEMPFTMDEVYTVNMEVPEGYVVDELPKQMLAKFDEEGKSFFEYRIQHEDGRIAFRSRIKFHRAFYKPEEYDVLREFFNIIVKKQNEQIVFKKK